MHLAFLCHTHGCVDNYSIITTQQGTTGYSDAYIYVRTSYIVSLHNVNKIHIIILYQIAK